MIRLFDFSANGLLKLIEYRGDCLVCTKVWPIHPSPHYLPSRDTSSPLRPNGGILLSLSLARPPWEERGTNLGEKEGEREKLFQINNQKTSKKVIEF